MNEIITKLDEIEKKANDMISDAKNRKEEMAAGLEKDKKALDEKYAAMQQEKMRKLSAELEQAAKEEIQREQDTVREAMEHLEEHFAKDQDALAREVFERIIA